MEEDRVKMWQTKILVAKFSQLRRQAKAKGLDHGTIRDVLLASSETVDKTDSGNWNKALKTFWKTLHYMSSMQFIFLALFFGFLAVVVSDLLSSEVKNVGDFKLLLRDAPCLVSSNMVSMEVARPMAKCSFCDGLTEVTIERNLSTTDFMGKYAHTSVPVLIKDATLNWTAMSEFSFQFFKTLYTVHKGSLRQLDDQCQFFPYKTEFDSLAEAMNMSEARAAFTEGEAPWYIGWSNCVPKVSRTLRRYYDRPYFIPEQAVSSEVDWVFMGGSGLGAFIHLDHVEKPSWQAQISGRKTWTLIPVPECEDVCHAMNVTVHKGDIIVIDTNQWYHATYIHPGEISITIGSEYELV